MLIDWRCKACF